MLLLRPHHDVAEQLCEGADAGRVPTDRAATQPEGACALDSVQPGGGPTVRRLQLGARLRHLRESKGISRAEAGYLIRGSESKISRMELGRVSFKERDVTDLLKLYGVADPAEHERLIALAREANTPSWWHT